MLGTRHIFVLTVKLITSPTHPLVVFQGRKVRGGGRRDTGRQVDRETQRREKGRRATGNETGDRQGDGKQAMRREKGRQTGRREKFRRETGRETER